MNSLFDVFFPQYSTRIHTSAEHCGYTHCSLQPSPAQSDKRNQRSTWKSSVTEITAPTVRDSTERHASKRLLELHQASRDPDTRASEPADRLTLSKPGRQRCVVLRALHHSAEMPGPTKHLVNPRSLIYSYHSF